MAASYEYLGEDVLEEPEREVVEEVNVLQRLQREVQLAARDGEAVVQSGDSLHLRNHVSGVLHLRPQTPGKNKNKREGESPCMLSHDTSCHSQQQVHPILYLNQSIAWSANHSIAPGGTAAQLN